MRASRCTLRILAHPCASVYFLPAALLAVDFLGPLRRVGRFHAPPAFGAWPVEELPRVAERDPVEMARVGMLPGKGRLFSRRKARSSSPISNAVWHWRQRFVIMVSSNLPARIRDCYDSIIPIMPANPRKTRLSLKKQDTHPSSILDRAKKNKDAVRAAKMILEHYGDTLDMLSRT